MEMGTVIPLLPNPPLEKQRKERRERCVRLFNAAALMPLFFFFF